MIGLIIQWDLDSRQVHILRTGFWSPSVHFPGPPPKSMKSQLEMDPAEECLAGAYLGIQDALPGAWTGTVVFNEEGMGIVLFIFQEKWDRRINAIFEKWLACLQTEDGAHYWCLSRFDTVSKGFSFVNRDFER